LIVFYFISENNMRVPVNARENAIPKFLEWLKEHGAEFDGVEISTFESYGLGLRADRNFEEGNMLMAIPRKIMLTLENARVSELGENKI
jgi:protein-histidine N-methyltransferase